MKLAILAAFVLAYPISAVAQLVQSPKEFAGVPWSADKDAAKTTLLAQGGISFWKAVPDRNKIMFKGGTFAGSPATLWHLYFPGGKFARGLVDFESGGRQNYVKLKEQLIAKYGRPKTEKTTHQDTETIWDFPAGADNPHHTSIHLQLLHGETFKVWYNNDSLWHSTGESDGAGL